MADSISRRKRSGRDAAIECDLCPHAACSKAKDCFGQRDAFAGRYREDPATLDIARAAAEVEAAFYGQATRLEEILHFARKIGARHLGVAFCTGFREEARIFCELMRTHLRVSSVCCKACAVPKKEFGFPHVHAAPRESMCNPLGQAELLNRAGTDLNVLIGLCVGHDSIFFRASRAPATVFAVKDRVLAHNPVGALYSRYTRRRLQEGLFAPVDQRPDSAGPSPAPRGRAGVQSKTNKRPPRRTTSS